MTRHPSRRQVLGTLAATLAAPALLGHARPVIAQTRRLKIDIWFSRPVRALAARIKREHQRAAAPVHAQRHRPRRCLSDLARAT